MGGKHSRFSLVFYIFWFLNKTIEIIQFLGEGGDGEGAVSAGYTPSKIFIFYGFIYFLKLKLTKYVWGGFVECEYHLHF